MDITTANIISCVYLSPLGELNLIALNDQLIRITFNKAEDFIVKEDKFLGQVRRQLDGYFNKEVREFNIPAKINGTVLQERVWDELNNVAYGEVISYTDLASRIGMKNSIRAVANAVGANPLPIIIPCHRIISKSGKLTGYIGGIERKQWLLNFEGGQQSIF